MNDLVSSSLARIRRKENGKLTPADKGVDAQPDLVGRKRLDDEHVEVKTCCI